MKNGTAYGTTEYTEKDSVYSKKKMKRQRHRGVGNRLVGRERLLWGDRGINHYEGTEGRE